MNPPRIGFDKRVQQAVRAFWRSRLTAVETQRSRGRQDQGNRAAVTSGKTLDSFREMITDLVKRHAPRGTEIHREKSMVVVPGFFRPTKSWDLLLTYQDRLFAALELKSLCGPSFGNNANNRCEEALGSGFDFRKAQSEGLFGVGAAPFLGYFILVEDAPGSRSAVAAKSPHFPTDPQFEGACYQTRMRLMCERLIQHQIYSSASVMTAPASITSGAWQDLSMPTSFRALLARLAAHLDAERNSLDSNEGRLEETATPYASALNLDGEIFESTETERDDTL